ncbi:MAG: hypothetical protein ACE5HD_01065 [Acidobacteriota bacterium]
MDARSVLPRMGGWIISGSLVLAGEAAVPSSLAVRVPDAILVQLTEDDLTTLIRQYDAAPGVPSFSGHRGVVKGKIHDVDYAIGLSGSRFTILPDGIIRLSTTISSTSIHARAAYKIRKDGRPSRLQCHDLQVDLDPTRPVRLQMQFQLSLGDDGLRVVSGQVELPDGAEGFQVSKPRSCQGAWIFNPLLRRMTRKKVRKKLRDLGAILQAVLEKEVASLGKRSLLEEELKVRTPLGGGARHLLLRPAALDSRHRAIHLALALESPRGEEKILDPDPGDRGLDDGGGEGAGEENAFPAPLMPHSYIAVAERAFQMLFHLMVTDPGHPPLRLVAGGRMADGIPAALLAGLFPGLNDLPAGAKLDLSLGLRTPPQVSIEPDAATGAAVVDVRGATDLDQLPTSGEACREEGFELGLWSLAGEEPTPVGSVFLVPHLQFIPGLSAGGKLSLRLRGEGWTACASGIETDDVALEKVLQAALGPARLASQLRPLNFPFLRLGERSLQAAGFRAQGGYLTVEMETREVQP